MAGVDNERVNYVLTYGEFKPVDLFKIGDIIEREFGLVKDVQEAFNYGSLTFEKYLKIMVEYSFTSEKTFYNTSVYDIKSSLVFLTNEIEKINELETESLGRESSAEEKQADSDRFQKYRSFMQFDSLCGGDILKFEQMKKVPYLICFTKMMLEADRAEFNKDLHKIQMRKNKQ